MSQPNYLTVDDVAEMLRVSRMTVYRLLETNQLGHVRIGKSFRIPSSALDEYVAVNTHAPVLR